MTCGISGDVSSSDDVVTTEMASDFRFRSSGGVTVKEVSFLRSSQLVSSFTEELCRDSPIYIRENHKGHSIPQLLKF